ncbi:MAG: VOC family protein [Acidimicrobiales bacterium]
MTDPRQRDQMSRNGTRHGDVSYVSIGVPDGAGGRAFYGSVLGWRFAASPPGATGNQVEEVIPEVGLWSGDEPGPPARHGAVLAFRVDGIDAAVAALRQAGGTATGPARRPYGLESDCSDGHGLGFWLHQLPPAGLPAPQSGQRQGDLSYVVLSVEDLDAAARLFAAVLGWETSPGPGGGLQVQGVAPLVGIGAGGPALPGAVLCYRVDDIVAAVESVREVGGTATEPARRPYGLESSCADDQGIPFYLHQLSG